MQNDGKLFYQFLDDKEDQRYKEMYEEYYEKDEVSAGEYSNNMTVAGRSGFPDNFSINDVKAFADQILTLIDFDKISMIAQGKSRKRRQEAEDMQEYNAGDHGDHDDYKKGHHGHKKGHKSHKKVFYERRKHGNIPFGFPLISMEYKVNESCEKEILDASQRWTGGCTEDIDGVKQCLGFLGKYLIHMIVLISLLTLNFKQLYTFQALTVMRLFAIGEMKKLSFPTVLLLKKASINFGRLTSVTSPTRKFRF